MTNDPKGKVPDDGKVFPKMDKFCDEVYSLLVGGALGTVFSQYPEIDNTLIGSVSESRFRRYVITPARRAVASKLETSAFAQLYGCFVKYLLSVRLRIYGLFLFSFLIYSAVFAALRLFRGGNADLTLVIVPAIISLGCIPMFLTGKSLSQALATSKTGSFILRLTGQRPEQLDLERVGGRGDLALIVSLVLSLLTFFVPFWIIVAAILGITFVFMVVSSPEFGTVCLFFFMPILPTMFLAGLVSLTIFSFILRAMLARRVFRFEAIDLMLLPFVLLMTVGTFFGADRTSIQSGGLSIAFCVCFYIVVFTMTTREWLRRAMVSLLISCSAVSIYGILDYSRQTVLGNAVENDWVDTQMFGYITGRATATLDNPNMLSVYLIIVLPIAFCSMITLAKNARQRFVSFISFSVIFVCLGLTWTRGAWLGAVASLAILIIVWSRRSIYMIFAGLISIPLLPHILPANIWARFTSIGSLADTSSSYRFNILKSVADLLPRFLMNGLGFGEESWHSIWEPNAITGVETAAHTHNLYTQIWLQTGMISLVIFVFFMGLLFLSNFNFYRRLRNADDSIMSHISVGSLKETGGDTPGSSEKQSEKSGAKKKKTVLRLEAAAPACGIFAALLMGFTDYIWYNYRVMLIFWLVCGLSSANVRVGRRELEYSNGSVSQTEAEVEIPLEQKKNK